MSDREFEQNIADEQANHTFSSGWRTYEYHQRIPLEDAIRNARVLARGIFGIEVNILELTRKPAEGEKPRILTPEEEEIKIMLVGYLREQCHNRREVAEAVGIEIQDLDEWGWRNKDWLIRAQEQAVELEKERRDLGIEGARPKVLDKEGRMRAMDRILELVLDDYPATGKGKRGGRFKISKDFIRSSRSLRMLVKIRRTFSMHSIEIIKASSVDIGGYLGKDHSTILHYERSMQEVLKDPEKRAVFYAQQEKIRKKLREEGLM